MKYVPAHMMHFLRQRGARRNLGALSRFMIALAGLITLYSIVFHYVMMYEGREYSWLTGFYWTLTVMSTLGFGDITFHTDLGRLFSMFVLLTGIICLMILLPFTIIQFFYAPWVEAQSAARTPRLLPESTRGHVILTSHEPVAAALIRKLEQYGYGYVLLCAEMDEAMRLHDQGVRVVLGHLDDPQTYVNVRADKAALVATTQNDVINTNVTFTVRQVCPSLQVVATAARAISIDILDRAGATHVLHLGEMMGKALARCMVGGDALTHVVGGVDDLLIAEANAQRTPLVGKTLRENALSDLGVSVVGIWDRGRLLPALPDTVVGEHAILLLAGSAAQLAAYDENFVIYNVSVKPVVIIGGGRVGQAAARALGTRGVEWRLVDKDARSVPEGERGIVGDAADPMVLKQAGLLEAPAVLITSPDDSLNIYLTIYCRSIRPDIQIISRATLERNTETLHRAGADFVLSYASMGSTSIFNLLKRGRVLTIAEGLEVSRHAVPASLAGTTIATCGVRERSGCSILGLRDEEGELEINPRAGTVLTPGREMILVGSGDAQARFIEAFMDE